MVLFAAASLLAVFSLPCFRPLLFSTDNVDACEKGSSSSACTCAAPSSLVVCLALVLFMLVDVTYFLRTFAMGLWLRFTAERHSLLSEVTTNSVVWLTDIDFMQHMNNSKYLRAMDFARFKLWISNGVWGHLRSLRATMVLGAVSVRYRKSLNLLERFSIKCQVVCWDEKAFYVEQRFVSGGMVKAIAIAKQSLIGTTTKDVLAKLGMENEVSPTPPKWVESFIESNSASSNALRRESKLPAKGE